MRNLHCFIMSINRYQLMHRVFTFINRWTVFTLGERNALTWITACHKKRNKKGHVCLKAFATLTWLDSSIIILSFLHVYKYQISITIWIAPYMEVTRYAKTNTNVLRCIWMDYNYISVVFFRIRKYIAWNTSLLSSCKFLYKTQMGWIYLLGMDYEIMSMVSCPVWVYILFQKPMFTAMQDRCFYL